MKKAALPLLFLMTWGCVTSTSYLPLEKNSLKDVEKLAILIMGEPKFEVHHKTAETTSFDYLSPMWSLLYKKTKDQKHAQMLAPQRELSSRSVFTSTLKQTLETSKRFEWVTFLSNEEDLKDLSDCQAVVVFKLVEWGLRPKGGRRWQSESQPSIMVPYMAFDIRMVRFVDNKTIWQEYLPMEGYSVSTMHEYLRRKDLVKVDIAAMASKVGEHVAHLLIGKATAQDPKETQKAVAGEPGIRDQKTIAPVQPAKIHRNTPPSPSGQSVVVDNVKSTVVRNIQPGRLSGKDMQLLLSGSVVKCHHQKKSFDFIRYFKEDGTLVQIIQNKNKNKKKLIGRWKVNQQKLCVYFKHVGEHCHEMVKEDGQIRQYATDPFQGKKLVIIYNEFIKKKAAP